MSIRWWSVFLILSTVAEPVPRRAAKRDPPTVDTQLLNPIPDRLLTTEAR